MVFIKKTHIYFKLEISYLLGNIKFQRNSTNDGRQGTQHEKQSLIVFEFHNSNNKIPGYTCCKSQIIIYANLLHTHFAGYSTISLSFIY